MAPSLQERAGEPKRAVETRRGDSDMIHGLTGLRIDQD